MISFKQEERMSAIEVCENLLIAKQFSIEGI